jgi:hypothetical protein
VSAIPWFIAAASAALFLFVFLTEWDRAARPKLHIAVLAASLSNYFVWVAVLTLTLFP